MAKFDMHTFKPEDFDSFVPQKMQEEEYDSFVKKGVTLVEYLEKERNTVTVQKNKKTIAVFGVLPLEDNGCHVWLFFGNDLEQTDILIAIRMVSGAIDTLEEMGYSWMQTPVREDFEEGERMIRMLDFEPTEVTEDLLEDGTIYRYWMRVF